MRVARDRLKRFANRNKCVEAIARFAVKAVERELNHAEIFARDVERQITLPDARAARARRWQAALAVSLPNESDELRNRRLGVAYAGIPIAIPMHRSGSALWAAIKKKLAVKRPHSATNAELFAALGLIFAIEGMSWRPSIYGKKGVNSLIDEGDDAVRTVLDGFAQATQSLLDAAECVYGWQHLCKPKEPKTDWIKTLHETLFEYVQPGGYKGNYMNPKVAHKHFEAAHPLFKKKASRTFENEYREAIDAAQLT